MNGSDKNQKCDVLVIGGGPAGTTFARLIDSKKYRVVLVSEQFDDKSKPCGGLLAPDAQRVLAEFDLSLPKRALVDPQIFSVKTIDVKTGLIRYYPRFYMNMDRQAFDNWLLSLIPQTTRVINGKCVEIKRSEEAFVAQIKVGADKIQIESKVVVGADGANSFVRRTFFPQYKVKSYVALQQWFKADNIDPFYSCIFDKETSPACSWSIVKDSYFIFGGAFEARKCRKNFENQKKRLERFGFRFGAPVKTQACKVLRPTLFSGFCTGKNGVYLIGEAAGFISPSSFEGISYAIKSGIALSKAVNRRGLYARNEYCKETRALRIKLIFKCIKRIFMYVPFFRRIIMKSRIQSIELKNNG